MTKKDYLRAAEIIRTTYGGTARLTTDEGKGVSQEFVRAELVETFVTFFRINPEFNEARFRLACEPKKSAKQP